MKIFATVPVKAVSSSAIRQPRVVHCKISAKRSLLKRFQQAVESMKKNLTSRKKYEKRPFPA